MLLSFVLLLFCQSYDLHDNSPHNFFERWWLGERRPVCLYEDTDTYCVKSVYLQIDFSSEFFTILFLQFIRHAEAEINEPARVLTKGCWSFVFLALSLICIFFTAHYYGLPWHSIFIPLFIAVIYDRGGEKACLFFNSWTIFLLYQGFMGLLCPGQKKE